MPSGGNGGLMLRVKRHGTTATAYNEASMTLSAYWDDSGNMGIGTNSPGTSLEIYKSLASTTTAQQMLIINTDYASGIGAGFGGSIVFRGRTAGNALQDNAQILGYNEDTNDNGYALGFFTRPTVGAGMVQRMTILRGGNVGIGTTNPLAKLHVNAGSGAISMQDYKYKVYNLDASILENNTYQRFSIDINTSNTTYPRTSGYVRVTVVPNPDGGIGFVYSSVAEFSIWRIDGNNNANFKIISVDNGTIGIATPVASGNTVIFGFTMPNNGTSTSPNFTIRIEIMAGDVSNYVVTPITSATAHTGTNLSSYKVLTSDTTRLVGIGTTTPAGALDVSGTGNIYISNKTSAPTNTAQVPGTLIFAGTGWNTQTGSQPIAGQIGLAAVYGALNGGSTEPAITFSLQGTGSGTYNATAGPITLTERMRLDNYGRLGIGTDVPGTGYAGAISNVKLALRGGTVGQNGGTSTLLIGGDNNHYAAITGAHVSGGMTYLAFSTAITVSNPAERMRILSNGKINSGGVSEYYTAGDTVGTTSFYIDVPVENDNTGTANTYHIQASFSHANWGAYGCLLDTWYNARGAGNFIEQYDIRAVTSANGGSWSISKPSANSLRITKNAGTYPGGGPYWIRVTMAA
jgi:hypothetical protein